MIALLVLSTLGCAPTQGVSKPAFPETGGGGDDVDSSVGVDPCLSASTFGVLDDWLHRMWLVAHDAPGAAANDALPVFYELPGIASGGWYASELSPACAGEPAPFAAVCAEGVCYSVECVSGGGWHARIQDEAGLQGKGPMTFAGWAVTSSYVILDWAGDAPALALSMSVGALYAPEGTDWTYTASGVLDGALTLEASFPAVDPLGSVDIAIVEDVGSVNVDGAEVATWDGTRLTPTDTCGG